MSKWLRNCVKRFCYRTACLQGAIIIVIIISTSGPVDWKLVSDYVFSVPCILIPLIVKRVRLKQCSQSSNCVGTYKYDGCQIFLSRLCFNYCSRNIIYIYYLKWVLNVMDFQVRSLVYLNRKVDILL